MTLFRWSRVAAADATADSSINWQEGQAPSSVNDSARAMMAATAKYRDDIAGAIVTGGSSTTYTLTSYQQFDSFANMNSAMIAFTPHATNGSGPVALNVDSLGQKPLRASPNVDLAPGVLIQGTPYAATYNNTDGAWYLHGLFGNPYNVPLAAGMDYWGNAAPNSSFAFAQGQAISRTTYASLFAIIGTTYGGGDGGTTFNLPDKTGRVSAMKEPAINRLSPSYFGGNSTVIGAVGGAESTGLVTTNLPPYTPSGSVAAAGTISTLFASQINQGPSASVQVAQPPSAQSNQGLFSANVAVSATFSGLPQGGNSAPIRTTQPTIICNYIIRIL